MLRAELETEEGAAANERYEHCLSELQFLLHHESLGLIDAARPVAPMRRPVQTN